MDVIELLPFAALLLVIGAVAGVLAGLLGVGGGIVLVPAFFYAFAGLGYGGPALMQLCVATSLATIVVTSMRSVQSHHRRGAVDWTALTRWAPGIVLGAFAGVWVAARLGSAVLQMVFAVLAICVGLYMALGRVREGAGRAMPGTGPLTAISAPVGFLSTLMGIGGGSFGVPLLAWFGLPIHRAVATAAGFGVLIAVPAVLGFSFVTLPPESRPPFTLGAVNGPAFVLVIAMTLMTAPLGARLAHATDAGRLKRVFGLFLIAVAVNMGVEAAQSF